MVMILEIIAAVTIAFGVGIFFLGIQPVLDIIKLFHQGGFSHGVVFDLGTIFFLAGSVILVLFVPLGGLCPLKNSGGLLAILYIMLFAPMGIALSGGEGANPNISIGISRKFILNLGYEIPFLIILIAVMIHYNTISIVEIINAQKKFRWSLFSPLFLPGMAYLMILPAMLGIRPFDIVSAPQEISSGPAVEYGGRYLALFYIEQAFSLFIGIALFVDLFLGGSTNPFFLFIKMLIIFIPMVFIHAVFPRLKIEQAIGYLLRWPTLLAFIGLIIVVVLK